MTISKKIQIKTGTTRQETALMVAYINNSTSIKHQTVNKAYNIKQNINSKISRVVNEGEKGDVGH